MASLAVSNELNKKKWWDYSSTMSIMMGLKKRIFFFCVILQTSKFNVIHKNHVRDSKKQTKKTGNKMNEALTIGYIFI